MSSTAPSSGTPSFWAATRDARKVMVLDLGFLGDTVHLLPALWELRKHYANAELHVMVSEHIQGLLACAPWIDGVWGYPRFPKGPKPWQDFGRIGKLRAARFDAIINLNGSDRSSFLTWFSGAPWRLGRCERPSWIRRFQFTHRVTFPRDSALIARQHLRCLREAGFSCGEPHYEIQLPVASVEKLRDLLGTDVNQQRRWIHVSPFTTQDYKELPAAVLARSLNALHQQRPTHPIVLSCAGNDRETLKMAALVRQLDFRPMHVFEGSLSLADLVALLHGSLLHLGGDSGALHVAAMTGTPSVAWFRRYAGAISWLPEGENNRILVGEATPSGLSSLSEQDVLAAALAFLP
jgi:heptosyltransferase-1